MEILLAIAIATAVTSHGLKNAVVDILWATRGQPSPRRKAAAARPATRGAFGSYWAELWRDSWTDTHARHSRRRQRRLARPTRPGAFRNYAGVVARDGWRRWDAAWDERAERRQARPRPVPSRPAPVVVPADPPDPAPAAEPEPEREPAWHVTTPDGGQFITDNDPQWHRDRGHDVRPLHPETERDTMPPTDVDEYRAAQRDLNHLTVTDETPESLAANQRVHDTEQRVPWIARWPVNDTPEPTTTGRNTMTTATIGEVTGLSTAITNTGQAAEAAEGWGPALEQLSAGITAGGVGGGTTGHLAAAQEHFSAAAAALRAAEQELIAQLGVKEAYGATPDAGEKAFVVSE